MSERRVAPDYRRISDLKLWKDNPRNIKPFALFPELRYEVSNGRVLCAECHRKTDSYCRKRYAKFIGKEQEWQSPSL